MGPPVLWFALPAIPLALALAEICARLWIRGRSRYAVWSPRTRLVQLLDRESMPGLPLVARFEVNRDGERGDELPADAWDTYRVITLGGSSTECRYIDQRSTWPAHMQDFLNRRLNLALLGARRAHVGNLGRSLTTCRELALVLEKVLPRYGRLDAIVVMPGASDVVSWLSTGAPREIDRQASDSSHVFDEHPGKRFGWTPRKLALRRVLGAWKRSAFRTFDYLDGAGRGVGRARRLRAQAKEVLDAPPDAVPLLDHFDRSFRGLLRLAQAGARTVIVVRPCWARGELGTNSPELGWMFAAGDLTAGDVRAFYSQSVVDRLLEMVERRMSAIARELGVAEFDPKLLLRADLEHFYDVGHLTPAGCAIVGGAVGQAILRERKGRFASRLRVVAEEPQADVA